MEDKSIKKLVKRTIRSHCRSLFVILGAKGSSQVPFFFNLLKQNKLRDISTLWCSKESSNNTETVNTNLNTSSTISDADNSSFTPHYCSYSDVEDISYRSFNLVILQDFEVLTLNSLSLVLNVVKGGGIIIFLFNNLKNLDDLMNLNLNTEQKYSTFSKRFASFLHSCPNSLILDDSLNMLSAGPKLSEDIEFDRSFNKEKIEGLKMKHEKDTIICSLLNLCYTIEQAELLLKFLEAIKNRTFHAVLSVSSSIGRGKSAALGLAIAGSLAFNYSNIFISSLCYRNVNIIFKFLLKGLDVLNYKEDDDFDLIQSVNPKLKKAALTGINIFRDHPQSVRFIFPEDIGQRLGQAELVVIDEAAAIPIHILKNLFGSYIVLMASSISRPGASSPYLYKNMIDIIQPTTTFGSEGERFQKFAINDPIHYANGDGIESWFNRLLCVGPDICSHLSSGYPVPNQCKLFHVNRNALFGGSKQAENFLQFLMSILTSSYRIMSPDHLVNIADSPDYHIFCLLPPVTNSKQALSGVICAILVHVEYKIPEHLVHCGTNLDGPISNCFNDWLNRNKTSTRFLPIQGVHVLNIVTHQNYRKMGYGIQALQLLQEFYEGKCISLNENVETLQITDDISLNKDPSESPILQQLTEIHPGNVEYILASCNLSSESVKFWKKANFIPVYLSERMNADGEHVLFMIKAVEEGFKTTLEKYWFHFRNHYRIHLGSEFRAFKAALALSLMQFGTNFAKGDSKELVKADIDLLIRPHQMKSLKKYCQNLQDFHTIIHLVPILTTLYFKNHLQDVNLPRAQEAILLSFGFQYKTADDISKDLGLPVIQIHGLLNRTIKKIVNHLSNIIEKCVAEAMENREVTLEPIAQGLNEELEEAAKEIEEKQKQDVLNLKDLDLSQYAIKGSEDDWEKVLFSGRKALVSIKSIKNIPNTIEKSKNEENFKRPKQQKKRRKK
ncbi:RNA cytidine acetyltransferase [Caerostris extrusa]|uniref:RNA cytidine acetyltransferase n=1 Tax=Caerostris extrusa TaxID=172846 RepID=A0AAV4QUT6_CAEEX|nr:RNA cytidine acetyltransferase [Caerostris extrusa]